MKATATLLGTAPADLLADVHADNDGRRDSIGLAAFENVLSRTARAMLSLELGDRYLISNAAVRQGQDAWIGAGIHLNARPVNGRVVLRLGVQEVTRLGMGPTQMRQIAELIVRAAAGDLHVRTEVLRLRRQHRHVAYSFDTHLLEVSPRRWSSCSATPAPGSSSRCESRAVASA